LKGGREGNIVCSERNRGDDAQGKKQQGKRKREAGHFVLNSFYVMERIKKKRDSNDRKKGRNVIRMTI